MAATVWPRQLTVWGKSKTVSDRHSMWKDKSNPVSHSHSRWKGKSNIVSDRQHVEGRTW